MTLRVLEVIGNAITGGMERYVETLVSRLPAWIETQIVTPFASRITERWAAQGRTMHVASVDDDAKLLHSIERIVELAQRTHAQLLHSHLPNANVVCALASLASGIPAIATIHGRLFTLRDLECMRLSNAHALVVCNDALAQALFLGIDEARVTFVANGVDTSRFAPPTRHRETGSEVVGFVGRLSPEKEPFEFLRAAALIAERRPRATFRMIGDGPLRSAVEREVARSGLSARTRMTGVVDDMPTEYHALDLLISTSSSEGMPLAVLEAMACGVPVIATNAGAVPEIVCDGVTGRVLARPCAEALADAACILLADAATRHEWGVAARLRAVERYDCSLQVERVAALLAQVARYAPPNAIAAAAAMDSRVTTLRKN